MRHRSGLGHRGWFLVAGEHPAGEVAQVDEQAQAGQSLGKVADLPGMASWRRRTDRDEASTTDGWRRPVAEGT
jgi:hypothetical protein